MLFQKFVSQLLVKILSNSRIEDDNYSFLDRFCLKSHWNPKIERRITFAFLFILKNTPQISSVVDELHEIVLKARLLHKVHQCMLGEGK